MPRNKSEKLPEGLVHYIECCARTGEAGISSGVAGVYAAYERLCHNLRDEVRYAEASSTYQQWAQHWAKRYGIPYATQQK